MISVEVDQKGSVSWNPGALNSQKNYFPQELCTLIPTADGNDE